MVLIIIIIIIINIKLLYNLYTWICMKAHIDISDNRWTVRRRFGQSNIYNL